MHCKSINIFSQLGNYFFTVKRSLLVNKYSKAKNVKAITLYNNPSPKALLADTPTQDKLEIENYAAIFLENKD